MESSCNDDKSNVEAALAKSKGLHDGEMKDFEKAKAVNDQTIVGATQAVTRAKQNKVEQKCRKENFLRSQNFHC